MVWRKDARGTVCLFLHLLMDFGVFLPVGCCDWYCSGYGVLALSFWSFHLEVELLYHVVILS